MYRIDIDKLDKLELLVLIEYEGFTNLLDITADHTEDETRDKLIEALQDHGEWIENVHQDILDSIRNGNWEEGGKLMLEECITPTELVDYIEDYNEGMGYNMYSWFDMYSVIGICNTLATLAKEAN